MPFLWFVRALYAVAACCAILGMVRADWIAVATAGVVFILAAVVQVVSIGFKGDGR